MLIDIQQTGLLFGSGNARELRFYLFIIPSFIPNALTAMSLIKYANTIEATDDHRIPQFMAYNFLPTIKVRNRNWTIRMASRLFIELGSVVQSAAVLKAEIIPLSEQQSSFSLLFPGEYLWKHLRFWTRVVALALWILLFRRTETNFFLLLEGAFCDLIMVQMLWIVAAKSVATK